MADVPLQVVSENATAERRITPSWTISQLKTKLEPMTGIPPSSQQISLQVSAGAGKIPVEAQDEDAVQLSVFPLAPYAELHVSEASHRPWFTLSHCRRKHLPCLLALTDVTVLLSARGGDASSWDVSGIESPLRHDGIRSTLQTSQCDIGAKAMISKTLH